MNLSTVPASPALAAFVLRVSLALMWLSHGLLLKVFTFGMAGLAAWLPSVGLPSGLAYPLVLAETIGGLVILVGFHGRWASLALMPVLLGAAAIHWGNGWVFTNPQGGWEYPVFLLAASFVHVLLGDGALALRTARA